MDSEGARDGFLRSCEPQPPWVTAVSGGRAYKDALALLARMARRIAG